MNSRPSLRWRDVPRAGRTLLRTFGVRGALERAQHELRRRFGRYRVAPHLTSPHLTGQPLFTIDAGCLSSATDRGEAIDRANRVLEGEFQAYRWTWRPLPATRDDWFRQPATGQRFAADQPWWQLTLLSPELGDIKDVWEPARFGWVFDLARGYAVTGDTRYVACFEDYFGRWAEANPPFLGPHWACGQETAIRAIALLYAEGIFADAFATPDSRRRVIDVLTWSAERIDDAIGYALSQRNNHGVSEATGLIALGARFDGEISAAPGWLRRGHRLLERCLLDQFSPDGWYAAHSFTYMRVALDMCVVAHRALRSVGAGFSPPVMERLAAAHALLCTVIDPVRGYVPNCGSNDGAFVHPITLAPYRDFRPLVTAVAASFDLPVPAGLTTDREALAWLDGSAPPIGPAPADGVTTGSSGWAVAKVGTTQVFLRAGVLRHRPSHLDQLQLDVRLDGEEIVVDPGTFAYNASAPWRNGLADGRVHNGPLVDGREPGLRGPRFLWYLWPSGWIHRAEWDGTVATLVATRDGAVMREVQVSADHVVVRDSLIDVQDGPLEVTWLVHPDARRAVLEVGADVREHAASEDDTLGWFSPTYGFREPGRCLVARLHGGKPIVTRIRLSRAPR